MLGPGPRLKRLVKLMYEHELVLAEGLLNAAFVIVLELLQVIEYLALSVFLLIAHDIYII